MGEVLTECLTDHPDRFVSLRRAYLEAPGGVSREVRVTASWPHKGRFVLKLEGVDSIEAAERLRGLEVRIGEEELEALPEGSYYHHQLRGLRVEDPQGSPLGVVADLLETGAATVLVVRGSRGESLIPLAETFVRSVDVSAGRMVAERPEEVPEPRRAGARRR
jgi:16S rRNA processing protein RimM